MLFTKAKDLTNHIHFVTKCNEYAEFHITCIANAFKCGMLTSLMNLSRKKDTK